MAENATVRLNTTGLHCQSCSMLVQMTLEDLPGIESAKSDFVTGVTEVVYDPAAVTVDQMIDAIVGAGYGASVA